MEYLRKGWLVIKKQELLIVNELLIPNESQNLTKMSIEGKVISVVWRGVALI